MECAPAIEPAGDDEVILALRGLAQEVRLEVLALLAANGREGLPAGEIAVRLGVSPACLSFHFQQLVQARLVTRRRRSRQVIYAPNLRRMHWLLARLHEQWHSPPAGGQVYRMQSFPVELAEDELELVAGGGKPGCSGNGAEHFNISLILEILDNSTRRLLSN